MIKFIAAFKITFLGLFFSISAQAARPAIVETGSVKVANTTTASQMSPHLGTQFFRYRDVQKGDLVYLDRANLAAGPIHVSNIDTTRISDSKSGRFSISRRDDWYGLGTPDFLVIDAKSGTTTTIAGRRDDRYPAYILPSTVRFNKGETHAAILSSDKNPFIILDLANHRRFELEAGPELHRLQDTNCNAWLSHPCPKFDFRISDNADKLEFVAGFESGNTFKDQIYYFAWNLNTKKLIESKLIAEGVLNDAKFISTDSMLLSVYDRVSRLSPYKVVNTTSGQTTRQFTNGQWVFFFPSTNLLVVYGPYQSDKSQALDASSLNVVWEASFGAFPHDGWINSANLTGFVWQQERPQYGGDFSSLYFADAATNSFRYLDWTKFSATTNFGAYDSDEYVAVKSQSAFGPSDAEFQFYKIQ